MSKDFDVQSIQGLSDALAAQRQAQEGFNELPGSHRKGILSIVLDVIREPMFLLLVACGTLYLLMGREHIGDALMLLGFVFVVMGITIVQERRTERALEALRDLSSPRALVVRDGRQRRIAGRDVVRGDTVILSEGDCVPADGVMRYTINFTVNESLLTGESVPVRKSASKQDGAMDRPGGENRPFVYSGTMVTGGQGVAEVLAIGAETELGKIGKSLRAVQTEQTLLQRETGRLVKTLAVAGLTLCVLVVIIYGLTRGNTLGAWTDGLLVGITMAMATLPEELPVVLTIFLALGAWRISQKRVLTRRMPAIETLGAATVLCVDKTGTLTMNQMSVHELFASDQFFRVEELGGDPLPEQFHELLEFGILASKKSPFDPMEKALRQIGDDCLAQTEHLHDNWTLQHEYPLSAELLALSHVWRSPDGTELVVAAKGAPEAIWDLCHLDPNRIKELSARVAVMADKGLRVLGVARGVFWQSHLPQNQHDLHFTFVGFIGLADPVRPTVPAAIRECYTAGIRVVMITGDYPGTAQNIARRIGLSSPEEVICGRQLDQMSDDQLKERIRAVNIFARVVPEQKLRIVNALKSNREVVAMTGDGVNDAPALKSAHIGLAMGGRGTDVAREASSLVLLDDDFSSIVEAVKLGRRIFDNIQKAVSYIFAIHVPIAGLSMIPVFMGETWPVILMPIHVVFLELIIDPACSVIFEAENAERDIMTRPPRDPNQRLFSRHSLLLSILQGLAVLAVVLAVFVIARRHTPTDNARALTFVTLVVSNLCLILTNRSWTRTIVSMFKEPNKALWWVVTGGTVCLAMVLGLPWLRDLFHFDFFHARDWILSIVAGVGSILWFEIRKIILARRGKPANITDL